MEQQEPQAKFRAAERVAYAPNSIVSSELLHTGAGSITLFAFDEGQAMSEHTAPFDAVVQVIDGAAAITVGGREQRVETGETVVMPANVPHALRADQRFKMVLTMIRQ